jgi:hypothetical protein
MGPFLAAVIAVIGISFGAAFALEGFQQSADARYRTGGVRLDASEVGPVKHAAAPVAAAPSAQKPAGKN